MRRRTKDEEMKDGKESDFSDSMQKKEKRIRLAAIREKNKRVRTIHYMKKLNTGKQLSLHF